MGSLVRHTSSPSIPPAPSRTTNTNLTHHRYIRFSNAGMNILTDILVATLPLPFFNQLHLPKRQRIALMIIFALGGFTCIISILRLQSLLVFLQTTDFSYHNPLVAIWSSLEVNIGIICSCLPTLKAMVARWFPRAFGSSYHLRGLDQSHERRIRGTPEHPESSNNKTTAGASSSGSSNPAASDRYKGPPPFYSEAFGRGPGREPATQRTTVRSGVREQNERRGWGRGGKAEDSVEEIEFGALRDAGGNAGQQEGQHGIQVVRVVEQEVEKGYAGGGGNGGGGDAKSEEGSERELITTSGKRGRFS